MTKEEADKEIDEAVDQLIDLLADAMAQKHIKEAKPHEMDRKRSNAVRNRILKRR